MENKSNRGAEKELVEFAATLSPNMESEKVIELYGSLQDDHFLIESKLILIRTIFRRILDEAVAKAETEPPEYEQPMFR